MAVWLNVILYHNLLLNRSNSNEEALFHDLAMSSALQQRGGCQSDGCSGLRQCQGHCGLTSQT